MSAPFVPNQQLLSLQTTGLPGLSGTTLPRSILADQGWPDALIEDYDAKGLQQWREWQHVNPSRRTDPSGAGMEP